MYFYVIAKTLFCDLLVVYSWSNAIHWRPLLLSRYHHYFAKIADGQDFLPFSTALHTAELIEQTVHRELSYYSFEFGGSLSAHAV